MRFKGNKGPGGRSGKHRHKRGGHGHPKEDRFHHGHRSRIHTGEDRFRPGKRRFKDIDQEIAPSDLRAHVDTERCKGCGKCERACPSGAITVEDVALIDLSTCIGCGHCVDSCREQAISMFSLEGETQSQVG
ncbi:MAG: 4Fe-4S binding protein [Deltaproteobacteria bacterium]|nr:4Fe-4S binding protein [Deltaproteobacteria bacterium]